VRGKPAPKLILLDEVMAGLTLDEADLPVSIIRQLRDTGLHSCWSSTSSRLS